MHTSRSTTNKNASTKQLELRGTGGGIISAGDAFAPDEINYTTTAFGKARG